MYWDKRGILKIYNFCRRGRQGLAARSAALVKGGILLVEENTPFGTPRDNEGTPLDPALSVPARNHCTRCAKNCLRFPVAAFDLVCAYVRSAAAAAGLRRCAALRRSHGQDSNTSSDTPSFFSPLPCILREIPLKCNKEYSLIAY